MNYPRTFKPKPKKSSVNHINYLRVALIIFGVVLIGRLFYIQIIKHDHYQAQALAEHIKKFEISAPRGIIKMQDGNLAVPVVLNEVRYTIYADPQYISDSEATADKLISLIGGEKADLVKKLRVTNSRYVVLAKKMTKDQADRIKDLKLKGIGRKEVHVRTYPQGSLASQLLGFVNDDGEGQYGVEGYENSTLSGKSGLEKAVTDVRGIPLAVNNDNILEQPSPGKDLTLTIDIGMQTMVEDVLKSGIERTLAVRGSAIIMESKTGAIKAMANYPNYDPSQYDKISDLNIFINPTIASVWEPGSVMKPLLMGAAFTEGTLSPDSVYFDPGYVQVDDRRITNAFNYGAHNMSIRDVINKSLNTGAVYAMKSLGGGEINQQARTRWYNYLTEHYLFDKKTGIEQIGEVTGYINKPNEGDGLNVRYANMAFGQGISITPIQLIAAYNAILNGGTYYKPTLVASTDKTGDLVAQKAEVLASDIISAEASKNIREMTNDALEINYQNMKISGYTLGGKSGTAQVADGYGGYKPDLYNGTYIGYIEGDDGIKYIMMLRLDEPKTGALASYEASKVWAIMSAKLIDNFAIPAKKID